MLSSVGVFISFIFLTYVECAIEDRLKSDLINIYKHKAIETRELQEKPVNPEQVTYYLYTKNNSDQYIQLNKDNLDLLAGNKIVFFIHGWTNSRNISWYEDMKNAFLTNYEDYYVVQVDWKEPADQSYHVSCINAYDVAKIITNLILDLNQNCTVSLDNVLLIGHSLGGQLTGFVGKTIFKMTGWKLPRIIALDPAGPIFSERLDDQRLNKDDADIVEVIHSNGGTFGFKDPTGTIDFFPNGGSSQPGCKSFDPLDTSGENEPINCDHHRAHEYFAEALSNPKEFRAKKCTDWDNYKDGKCENEEEVAMGDITTKATGNFYLETNKERPFAKTVDKKVD